MNGNQAFKILGDSVLTPELLTESVPRPTSAFDALNTLLVTEQIARARDEGATFGDITLEPIDNFERCH